MAALDSQSASVLPIVSSSKKLFIENIVAFGDAEDILNDKIIKSDGGTITYTIDVRRQFMPGNYMMHVVGPDTSLERTLRLNYHSAIICREDVDPKLIHDLLIDSNCDRNGKHPELTKNFISRYDWMHFRNWGCDDDDSTNDDFEDFNRSEETSEKKFKDEFKKSLKSHFNCKYSVERDSESSFVIMSNSSLGPVVIGFVINTDSDTYTFIGGDWHYACLLTDQSSNQNFAFVFGDLYVNKYIGSDRETPIKNDIQKDQFTYKIENFLYKK